MLFQRIDVATDVIVSPEDAPPLPNVRRPSYTDNCATDPESQVYTKRVLGSFWNAAPIMY